MSRIWLVVMGMKFVGLIGLVGLSVLVVSIVIIVPIVRSLPSADRAALARIVLAGLVRSCDRGTRAQG
ncbi:MAG: hypothetical protein MUC68_09355 [Burkholderiaceae bacterium]|nr:hypothetical protein [Burkholderiaceae bacterium]